MERTVVELFAGVGGFRCGLNNINTIEDAKKEEKWKTQWFSQWEPADKRVQWAHDCYVNRFGTCVDINGNDTTNDDIHTVDKSTIPNHTLLLGGFPCQDYSVSSTLATSKGIEGKKGVLWYDIRDILEAKQPPFMLLENVDRLIKSPASQRGRDFGIILTCCRDLGYTVEWRVINAADYGFQQRRRRIFIFAYRNDTNYANNLGVSLTHSNDTDISSAYTNEIDKNLDAISLYINKEGFFAKSFAIDEIEAKHIKTTKLPEQIGTVSEQFQFNFENAGLMKDGIIYTVKVKPKYTEKQITLGDIMETETVDESFFISEDRLYYTNPSQDHSDETKGKLSDTERHTWQYIKGAKKIMRTSANGHEYVYSEGPVPMVDEYDKPARTMLTSEGGFSRTTHIVRDKQTGRIRLLTPRECERIQGFPTDWTKECKVNEEIIPMPTKKRNFMMGNALVVNLIKQMEPVLDEIITKE